MSKYAIEKNIRSIELIKQEYLYNDLPWFIGFSGGKDSTAVLKLCFLALKEIQNKYKPITIVYCDTGVEIPVLNILVYSTLNSIKSEAEQYGIPIDFLIAVPETKNKFFSKVIGKGYPTPTNKFRWCTDRLRIDPINKIFNQNKENKKILVLGVRNNESKERDKILQNHNSGKEYFYSQSGNKNTTIFAPIINYSVEEVWATIAYNSIPASLDGNELMSLYKKASGECPIIREPKSPPCGKSRFGCWTCTVVRKDNSVAGLISEGYSSLKPLHDLRNWLTEIRDLPENRMPSKRDGSVGKGSFTLETRKLILKKLLEAESQSGYKLIKEDEIEFIKKCWDEIN